MRLTCVIKIKHCLLMVHADHIRMYHIVFIVYSNIPRVPMGKLDNSLEATTSTMV